jgi:O-antigen ligase
MMVYMIGAVVVFSSMVDYKHQLMPALYALLAVGCIQAFGTIYGGPYTFGMHKNAIGASLGGIFVVVFDLWFQATETQKRRVLTVLLLWIGAGLMMSLSRGAWFGTVCGCFTVIALRRQWKALIKITAIGLPVVFLCYMSWSAGVQDYAFKLEPGGHNSIQQRYEHARQFLTQFERNPIIGTGLGWRKMIDSTNIILSTLAETGILGLITFTAIFVVFFRMIWWTHKRVRVDDPLFSLLTVGAGLMVARLGHGMFDHYWSRGALTAAWAAAGMATLAYLTVKVRERRAPG